MTENKRIGNIGEDIALEYLCQKGYSFVGRNLHYSHHELDLVMRDGEFVVFVEVKTRRHPIEDYRMRTITNEKLWNILSAIRMFRRERPFFYAFTPRIDVIFVTGDVLQYQPGTPYTDSLPYKVEHYEDPYQNRIADRVPQKSHWRRKKGY